MAVTATAKEFAGIYRNKQQHEPDFDAVLDRAETAGVTKVMLTGMSLTDVDFNLKIAQSRPQQCVITVGVHPYHASEPDTEGPGYLEKMSDIIEELLKQKPTPIAAFGELGLDYDHLAKASKDAQIRTFKAQLDLLVSKKFDLPLFLHCRAAFDDFVGVIKPYLPNLPRRGLVHSFVGTRSQMEALVSMGFDVSVNGFSFKDEESLEMVKAIPLENLQIETDAPWGEIPANSDMAKNYLTKAPPLPARKKKDKFQMGCMVKERNESCTMIQVALVVAGLKGVAVEEIAKAAWENSNEMFEMNAD